MYSPLALNEMAPKSALPFSSRPPIAILGVPFDPVTTPETVETIAAMIASRRTHYVITANVDFVVQALEDIELRKIIFDAHLVVCDGMPLVWASRFLGNPLPERVTGSDLVPRLLAEAERRGWRVFFLGGRQESLDNAVNRSLELHPALHLVGAYSPPFKPLLDLDHAEILRRVTTARPDLLLVAFGCPKQEKWINMHFRHLGVPVSIGVGATLAFIGGTLKRAPVWMQRTGTEWLFRFVQEPGRLGGRYTKGLWVFSRGILRQWNLLRSRRSHSRMKRTLATNTPTTVDTPAAPAAPVSTAGGAARPSWPSRAVLTAPERFDAVAVAEIGDTWIGASDALEVYVDLRETQFIDSTGVGLLVRLQKRLEARQSRLALCRPTPPVDRALKLMRIDGFFDRLADLPEESRKPASESQGPATKASSTATGLVVMWRGEVTAVTRGDILEQTMPRIEALLPGSTVDIDLAGVTFIDSSGIGLLVGLKKRAWGREITVRFRNPPLVVRNVIRLSCLEKYLLEDQPS